MLRSYVLVLPTVLAVLLVVIALGSGRAGSAATSGPPDSGKEKPFELKMPDSLHARHEAFHTEFVKAAQETGKVGDAARAIEKTGTAHFAKAKEAFVPLGLLPFLAEGKVTPDMREAIKKAD